MFKTNTTQYDVAEHLRSPREMLEYLEASMEEAQGDAAFIAHALGNIARAKRMSQVDFESFIDALGLMLHAEAVAGER